MPKHKKKYRKNTNYRSLFFGLVLGISILIILCIAKLPKSNFLVYDSSEDGSEIAEEQQQTIPLDIQKNNEKNALSALPSKSNVLGIKTSSFHVPILMYHYVENVQNRNDTKRIALNTTPYTLEQEVKTLSDAGYTFMTHNELMNVMDGKTMLPSKPILLTFDDGYRDFYTDAYPILKKYHVKATQYVISGFLDRQNHMLMSQVQEIAKDGLVEIGAHTVNHAWLKGQSLQKDIAEITQSKIALEQLTHLPIVSFAYPFGAFDQQAIDVVKQAGFRSALSTIPGIEQSNEQKFFLYRLRPGGRIGQNLLTWLESS